MSNADLAKVMDLRNLCIHSFNSFEKLFLKLQYKKLTEEESVEEFYNIRSEMIEIHKLFNVLDLPIYKKMNVKAAKQARIYLKDHFNLSDQAVVEADNE